MLHLFLMGLIKSSGSAFSFFQNEPFPSLDSQCRYKRSNSQVLIMRAVFWKLFLGSYLNSLHVCLKPLNLRRNNGPLRALANITLLFFVCLFCRLGLYIMFARWNDFSFNWTLLFSFELKKLALNQKTVILTNMKLGGKKTLCAGC